MTAMTTKPDTYGAGEFVGRICGLIVLLAGHTRHGLAPSEIAKKLGTSPANVTRMVAHLKSAGFVDDTPLKRLRLGPKVVQIALGHLSDMQQGEDELADLRRRYTPKN